MLKSIYLGVAVGGGWQALVAYINLACYYIFGLPLGYLLGFKANLGVKVLTFSSSSLVLLGLNANLESGLFRKIVFVIAGTLGRNDSWDSTANPASPVCCLQNQLE